MHATYFKIKPLIFYGSYINLFKSGVKLFYNEIITAIG